MEEKIRKLSQVQNIIKLQKIKIGTKFSKNYYCFNCFKEITKKEYTQKSYPHLPRVILKEINNKINKEYFIQVITINLCNAIGKTHNNFYDNYNLWVENLLESYSNSRKLYTDVKYAFVFATKRDEFRRKQYIFMGLYKKIKDDEKNKMRIWERLNKNEEVVSIDEKSIINIIEKSEKREVDMKLKIAE